MQKIASEERFFGVFFEENKRSAEAETCPFEVSLELANESQAIVCDYNYVFDPYVALHRFAAQNDLSDTILVIDEAHNLVDRGRGYYSPSLSEEQLGPMQRLLIPLGTDLHDDIESRLRSCITCHNFS